MRYWLFGLILFSMVATYGVVAFLPHSYLWITYVVLGVEALFLLVLFRSVLKPAQTVRHGMDLIAAQDFNNRLVDVGEPEADRVVKLFNTMIDKLRNERLQNMERESFLQLLIEASPMGVVMLDFDGKVSLVNPSFLKITGILSEENVVGRVIEDLPSELARRMADVPLGVSEEIRRGDIRRYRCYHLSFVQSGFPRQFYLLESLTEEVMRAERGAYEKVIRIISHEVNNTMGGVRSVLDTLHDLSDSDDLKEVIESCDNRCDQMTRFISSYADVVRVPEPVRSKIELNKMVGDMVPFLQGMAPADMALIFEPYKEEIEVEVDLALMQQVIVNIVKNAIESINKDGGMIRIVIYKQNERPVLEIANNGEPISEEVSTQLFSPFFTTKREGRGIGLTLISEILNRHNATYSLKTGSDGITRFQIQL
ncbi:MAG: PAS domain S-box protein [Muribaculaceae bacterium]|nr:PAS domain S-box protein [Muribaculaceae bacterium]